MGRQQQNKVQPHRKTYYKPVMLLIYILNFIVMLFLSQEQSTGIISDLLELCTMTSNSDTSFLDNLVVSLSQQLIDDFPAADPRWAESIPHGE